ncbi:5' exonuclease Apollo [Magallana gigas]|uniref:5' exonuclease Apollo n=1 Tax=Magallana gigas TaxID=29159 RepID=UPI003340C4B7
MNGKVIPGTPIAVDFWKTRECPNARLFFLTHLHGDHIVGLSSSWQHKIYCSEVTGKLLVERYDIDASLISPLETGCSHILYVDSDQIEQMSVTVINAHHCPGSVMFLFEGYFGKILYTGDFRFDSEMKDDPLMGNLLHADTLYLDNTYNSPKCVFPSREESFKQMMEIIQSHEDFHIKIGLRNLGKEDLLVKIAVDLNEWIKVPPSFFQLAELLDLPDVFITGETDARIEVVPFYSISNKNIERWNKECPTIALLPTSLYTGLEMSPFCNQENVYIVPYSDHSSFDELIEFVKFIKPGCIYPIVCAETRGPFGSSISDRADISVFEPYLCNKQGRNNEIPESVKRWMYGNRTALKPAKVLNKKPFTLARKRSLQNSKRGVHFDDSMEEFSEPKKKKTKYLNDKQLASDSNIDGKSTEQLHGNVRENSGSEVGGKSSPKNKLLAAIDNRTGENVQKEFSKKDNCGKSSDEEIPQYMERVEEKRESPAKEDHQGTQKTNLQQKDVGVNSVNKGADKNSHGQKRPSIKNFIQYVLDTDFVKSSHADSEGNPMDRNGGSCQDPEMPCRMERKMGLLRVIPLSSNTPQENYRSGKKQGSSCSSVCRPLLNVKPL